jgi:calcineurin-like phosphoesterase family protein
MDIFVIADTHFGHRSMTRYEGRPEDVDDLIITNWNALVTPDDLVIHLGDVAFGHSDAFAPLIARLHGRKILCLGNHEEKSPVWYMQRGFAFACRYFIFRGIAFSHKPMAPLPPECMMNVHGHVHRGEVGFENPTTVDAYTHNRAKYRRIQIEEMFAPLRLDEIIEGSGET